MVLVSLTTATGGGVFANLKWRSRVADNLFFGFLTFLKNFLGGPKSDNRQSIFVLHEVSHFLAPIPSLSKCPQSFTFQPPLYFRPGFAGNLFHTLIGSSKSWKEGERGKQPGSSIIYASLAYSVREQHRWLTLQRTWKSQSGNWFCCTSHCAYKVDIN